MVKRAIDACESSWKWVHLSRPVDDEKLGKWALAKARGYHETKVENDCALPGPFLFSLPLLEEYMLPFPFSEESGCSRQEI